MSKRVLRILVIALALMLLLPMTVSMAQEEAILRYPINPDPEHLNPFTQTTIAIGVVNSNIYESLIRVDTETGEILPGLAESWTVSDDGLVYTFSLRQGVMFHDIEGIEWENGDREFKSDDWVWAAHLSHTEDETVSQHVEWMEGVVGAAEFLAGEADTISGINAMDDYTIEVTLEAPNRLALVNHLGGVPAVPQEAYEQLGEDFANNPVGTGPFMFVEWLRDDHITLNANPEYWEEGYPLLDGIRFINVPDENTQLLMYREGELDFLFGFPSGQRTAVLEEFADQANEIPGLNVRYFGFKMDTGFFSDQPLVRQAFNHAFNKDLVWNELMEGARFPATLGVLPPAMPASTPATTYEYDLDRAAELLAEAGFADGEGLPEITLYVFASARDELSFPVLQQDLATLGVTLNIEIEDNSTYWDHIGQDDVEMFLSGWSAGLIDPSDVFDFLFYDGRDDTHYNNPEVNDLILAGRQETDPVAREQIYQQVHDIIMEEAPWIPSAYSKVTWLQQPWVEGFLPGGGGTHTAKLSRVSINRS